MTARRAKEKDDVRSDEPEKGVKTEESEKGVKGPTCVCVVCLRTGRSLPS